ncbi:PTS-dependent dihydroxyacetone kinase phosphotransferase subunit DhaM [Nonomuraea polychroma]|nr:phosphoenolpyruvate--protein phosphotransferase [Nonomuraea polychroma]
MASEGPGGKEARAGGGRVMVGLVLVSHSAGLATEAVALVLGIAGREAPVAAAGGTEDGRLGTSLDLIEAAVRAVDQGDGVVLVPDLGSSVLTARLVEEPGRVVVADVPFVEGAIAAAVTAGTGASLADVLAAAEESRTYRKL